LHQTSALIDELEQKIEQAEGKLEQLADEAEDAWEEVKGKIEDAKDGLSKSIKKLFSS
jgi:exonuclease VII small subunit